MEGKTKASISKEAIFNKETNGMRDWLCPVWGQIVSSSLRDIKCKAPGVGGNFNVLEKQEDSV